MFAAELPSCRAGLLARPVQVKLPKGPERDYFKRQLAEQYAQFEAEWYAEEEEEEEGGEGACEERQQAAGGGEAGKAEGQA